MPSIKQVVSQKVTFDNKTTYTVTGLTTKRTTYHNSMPYYSVTAPAGKKIIKLGYFCEPKGIGHKDHAPHADYPIFVYQANAVDSPVEIEVGKTGTYEIIAEDNDTYITQVDVPVNLAYSLDYIIE